MKYTILFLLAAPVGTITFGRLMFWYAEALGVSERGAGIIGVMAGTSLGIGLMMWRIMKAVQDDLAD